MAEKRGFDIRRRIIVGFAIFTVLFLVNTLVLTFALNDTVAGYDRFIDLILEKRSLSQSIAADVYISRIAERDFQMTGFVRYQDEMDLRIQVATSRLTRIEEIGMALGDEDATKNVTFLKGALAEYREAFVQLVEARSRQDEAAENSAGVALRSAISQVTPVLDLILEDAMSDLETGRVDLDNSRRASQTLAMALSGAILGVIILFSFILIRSISSPLKILLREVSRLAEKDLAERDVYGGRNELGVISRNLDTALDAIRNIIRASQETAVESMSLGELIYASSDESAGAVEEIHATIRAIVDGMANLVGNIHLSAEATSRINNAVTELESLIGEQSTSITQSTSAIEEMNSTIENVAAIARDREASAVNLQRVTEQGGTQISETDQIITDVAALAQDINEITEVIDAVADRTNLLAMNAAIEAAHAGEAGRGFSVVADEIRQLAESTAENAGRISQMVRTSIERIAQAHDSSGESLKAFENVREEVTVFTNALSEIGAAMAEMTQGSGEILKAAETISDTTGSISERSHAIVGGIQDIARLSGENEELASKSSEGVNEINGAIKDISTAITELKHRCQDSEESTKRLSDQLNEFST
jgi:methyl-accepting chemotaxis protein